jgi:hypothetical protein
MTDHTPPVWLWPEPASSDDGRHTGMVDRQALADQLCGEAVRRHRAIEGTLNGDDAGSTRATNVRLVWHGELTGLRVALCHLYGWDPRVDADKEGKADDLIVEWWRRHDPDYWVRGRQR